jgi:flagella basal body P-ring formation protein FlgA
MRMRLSLRSRVAVTAAVFAAFATAATCLGVVAAAQSTPSRADRMVIRSGDRVTVSVTIGAVHAYGSGIASGSGQLGDTIRVLPTAGRRALTARITGPATVEIRP